jgi:hypothetical protein
MGVDHAPLSIVLAEDHRRAGNELRIVVVYVARRRHFARPLPPGLAMAPDDREIICDCATNVIGRPITGLHVLPVELPKPGPVVATIVGMTIEIEVSCLGLRTENWLEVSPIEARIEVELLFM